MAKAKVSRRVQSADFRHLVAEEMEKYNRQIQWLKMHCDEQDERHDGVTAHVELEHDRITAIEETQARIIDLLYRITGEEAR